MSRPWMPLYVADYLRDTRRLTAAEHGAYLLLIMDYWTTGGLPDDDRQLARIACMTTAEWKRARPIISSYFQEGWKHKRIDAELAHATEVSDRRRTSALQRHNKKDANAAANAEQLDTHTRGLSPSQSPSKKTDTPAVAKATRSALEEEFEKFWKAYPKREGSNPRDPARKLFSAALKAGARAEDIREGAAKFALKEAKNVGTPYIPQAVKWLRARCWRDYPTSDLEQVDPLPSGFHAKAESPQYDAWQSFKQRSQPGWCARDRDGGWWFPTEWPPSPLEEHAA